ncbi:helix-turn-helix domain-containing protein [Butyrivibrio fibrisolvens]|uniref:helix-turn-helix domain-containing protein n=1 Tax=Pseudobutyrivibrio ruminis TaxID=46206 RepID=UPI0004067B6F|nr:helix-turn-helix transcriptional regulator [Pseudobutyrivibrio ruminis]MDC7279819.1 helix-turn-helix domain-containing protein [Butyrivibrio fibrisolvens]
MDKEKTGLLIKSARLQKGYTQTELGDILGVSNKAISRWENGDSFPDVGILEDLSNCLDISIEKLVSGESSEDKEEALSELLRIVKIQARDSVRRKIDIISNIIILIIILIRFYFAFVSGKGYSWNFKYDIVFLVICNLILIGSTTRKSLVCEDKRDNQYRIISLITLLLFVVSVVIMIGAIYYLDLLAVYVAPENYGPLLSKILGSITLASIGLFEYEWYKLKHMKKVSASAVFVSVANVFLCISYREWMGSLVTYEDALQSIGVLSISIFIVLIITMVVMKYIQKYGNLD